MMNRGGPRIRKAALAALLGLGLLSQAGCQRSGADENAKAPQAAAPAAKDEDAKKEAAAGDADEGVTLTAEQVEKLGVMTEPAKASDFSAQVVGYGVVVAHDTVATAVAELATAQAAQAQSRAALARTQRLAGTPGAMSADSVETATRQLATDTAALALAEHRLSSVIGSGPSGALAASDSTLQELASGKAKLLRATFPLGALPGATPASLRAAHLDAAAASWSLHPVWIAPSDASLPGRSFFAVLRSDEAGEGERLQVWAPGNGPAQHGVLIPAAALVISAGQYWCYVERKAGVYERLPMATDKPLGDDYVVTDGIAAGDKIVIRAAGLLLARELNPSTEAD